MRLVAGIVIAVVNRGATMWDLIDCAAARVAGLGSGYPSAAA